MMPRDDFYRQLLDSLYDGVYFVDRRRNITYWNQSAERMSGYSSAEVVGRCCADSLLRHCTEDGTELCQGGCPLVTAMNSSLPQEADVFLHHKDGYRLPVSVRVCPIRDETGEVMGAVEVFSDNSRGLAARRRAEELEKMAMRCPLTGLGNRRYAAMMLETRIAELHTHGLAFAVLYLDIDHFKRINDTHGHEAGDTVLQNIAQSLRHSLREGDVVCRWGGEEFIAILSHTSAMDEERLRGTAERCRVLVEKSHVPIEDGTIQATISIGATCGKAGDTSESLLKRADELLYRSKKAGRNCVTLSFS